MKHQTSFTIMIFLLGFMAISLTSCTNKDALFEKFEEIKTQIEKSDYEGLVANIDKKSRNYIELITDTRDCSLNCV